MSLSSYSIFDLEPGKLEFKMLLFLIARSYVVNRISALFYLSHSCPTLTLLSPHFLLTFISLSSHFQALKVREISKIIKNPLGRKAYKKTLRDFSKAIKRSSKD